MNPLTKALALGVANVATFLLLRMEKLHFKVFGHDLGFTFAPTVLHDIVFVIASIVLFAVSVLLSGKLSLPKHVACRKFFQNKLTRR